MRQKLADLKATVDRYAGIYWQYFVQYWKSRLVYKGDFLLGVVSQAISLAGSLAFLGLLFTQVDNINGWTFHEMLLLAGVGGFIMNLHHLFLFEIYRLGQDFVVEGGMDRVLVRPLNPLFQVYASGVSDNNLSKFLVNIALIGYAIQHISMPIVTPANLLYFAAATVSGVLVFAAIYLVFATTAFWTGRSDAALWFIFQITDFRKYPYDIYSAGIRILLVTAIPLAFASFFPTTFLLDLTQWRQWQLLTLLAGPIFYILAYQFWKVGLGNYSSTGS